MGYLVPVGHRSELAGAVDAACRSRASTYSTMSATTTNLADGDAGVEQTINLMRSLVISGDPRDGAGSSSDPYIRQAAGTIIMDIDPRDQMSQARAIFDWVKDNIRFVRDPNRKELVQNPRVTLMLGFGDCDCIHTLLASMLESVGFSLAFATVGLGSPEFDHVFDVLMLNGRQIPLDRARPNPEFGVTSENVFRAQLWPIYPDDGDGMGKLVNTSARSQLNGAIANLGDGFDPSDPGTWPTPGDYSSLSTDQQYSVIAWQQIANPDVTTYGGQPPDDGNHLPGNATLVPPGLSATQIANLIAQGGNAAANVLRAINTPTSPYYNPQSPYYGRTGLPTTSLFGSGSTFGGLSINAVLLAVGAVLVLKK